MELTEIGWNSLMGPLPESGRAGRVALALGESFLVWTDKGEIEAVVSGHLRYSGAQPCVGDWVSLRDEKVIEDIFPRHSQLSRKQPGKEHRGQALATNLDVLFVVSGLDQDHNLRRLERYLVVAHNSGARPVILLNKADLCDSLPQAMAETRAIAPGVPVVALSAREGWGLEEVPTFVRPRETAVLIGSSGAGKSTLVNRLLGHDRQRVKETRPGDGRGRHTTTRRELMQMPEGWMLMDLPGLREVQLWGEPDVLDEAFREIAELSAQCRFRDCTHQQEPHCAVRAAAIDERRLASYHKLKRELLYLERESDKHLARALRKKWNAMEKAVRSHPKRRF